MLELFVGDVVYYVTTDQTLAKDKIKSIGRTKGKGRSKHIYTLFNGMSKQESDLFLSLKRAKAHFERINMKLIIPKSIEAD